MNQRLKHQLEDHKTPVLLLALMALSSIKRALDDGMSEDEQALTLCNHVSIYLNLEGHNPYHREIQSLLRKTAKVWPSYSGNQTVPVPAPDDFVSQSELSPAEEVYELVFHGRLFNGSFWDQATEYGRMRVDLLNHHIQVIQQELDDRRSEV
ncbi:hypothetical protein [Xanthomonas phage vB_XooS_NR08]|nr:hypothetical protein [Xanthomonas phage vB_XooS_NR08]